MCNAENPDPDEIVLRVNKVLDVNVLCTTKS